MGWREVKKSSTAALLSQKVATDGLLSTENPGLRLTFVTSFVFVA
jgi:hypothetical protein